MQTDTQTSNENITPNSRELELLKKYFPQCFSKPDTDENGSITKEHFDIEKLADILKKDDVDVKKEGYALNFLGKSYAHYQANLDSETVIVPAEKNAGTESENVYIVGDNLDALQHLKYSYAEKIKCIYIDPPYNTGKDDFVYNDKFGFSAKELEEKLDVDAEEAERIVSMNGKCTHSAWLTFMYPRLALARELLRDDGVIFISIDDNEQADLKLLCDEVFGEGNFVGNFLWKKKSTSTNVENALVSPQTDYQLCYAKNISPKSLNRRETTTEDRQYPFEDDSGKYRTTIIEKKDSGDYARATMKYSIMGIYPREGKRWQIGEKTAREYEKMNRFIIDNGVIKLKIYEKDDKSTFSANQTLLLDYGSSDSASKEVNVGLFNLPELFSNPKPVELISHFIKISTQPNRDSVGIPNPCGNSGGAPQYDAAPGHSEGAATAATEESRLQGDVSVAGKSPLPQHDGSSSTETPLGVSNPCDNNRHSELGSESVQSEMLNQVQHDGNCSLSTDNCPLILDFFSGSGTTAHAVMDLNAKDGGNRKFIMVQLDESVKKGSEAEKAGFRTIDEIGRERIRRAAKKIRDENPLTAETLDLGFKTYYLKSVPKETLDKIKVFNPNDLISSDANIVKSLGEATVLETWQIKDGFGFNTKAQKIDLAGSSAYLLDDEKIGKYLYLLSEIQEKSVKELVRKIEALELTVDKIFLYGYSFDFDMLNSIKTNLKTLKNRNPIEPIVRY